jgi:hypothetical protein
MSCPETETIRDRFAGAAPADELSQIGMAWLLRRAGAGGEAALTLVSPFP